MRIIPGNILSVRKGIIVHQVNCQRVMGAGLALKIKSMYPKHYSDYLNTPPILGGTCITEVNPELFVVGVYGQDRFGSGRVYTNYDMLRKGLNTVATLSKEKHLPVYLPFGIGCGLAGGSWDIVLPIIKEVLPDSVVVKFGENGHQSGRYKR